jgi:hypothetical protein
MLSFRDITGTSRPSVKEDGVPELIPRVLGFTAMVHGRPATVTGRAKTLPTEPAGVSSP